MAYDYSYHPEPAKNKEAGRNASETKSDSGIPSEARIGGSQVECSTCGKWHDKYTDCPTCGKVKYEEKGSRAVKGPRDFRDIGKEYRGHYMGTRAGGTGKGGTIAKGPQDFRNKNKSGGVTGYGK